MPLLNNQGTENPFRLWQELGELMTRIARSFATTRLCSSTDAKLVEMRERFRKVNLSDAHAVGEHQRGLHSPALTTCCNCQG